MPAEPKFEVYKDHAEKYRWRLRASNDEEIASGQGYESKEGCMRGIESVVWSLPSPPQIGNMINHKKTRKFGNLAISRKLFKLV